MSDERTGNNRVYIRGEIVSKFSYSHEAYGKRFYMADICICRNSGYRDVVPFIASDKLMDAGHDYCGQMVSVYGQFHSYNSRGRGWRRLKLFLFAHEIDFSGGEPAENRVDNEIILEGVLCKEPVYRKTPLGREITDVLLAVNRPYGKTDYIPCIAWGWNAVAAARLKVGTAVKIQGRIQSREYVKLLGEETETRVAYEVSVNILSLTGNAGETPVETIAALKWPEIMSRSISNQKWM